MSPESLRVIAAAQDATLSRREMHEPTAASVDKDAKVVKDSMGPWESQGQPMKAKATNFIAEGYLVL